MKIFPHERGSKPHKTFTEAKNEFDQAYQHRKTLDQSMVPVDGKIVNNIRIRNDDGEPLEEYYKWQFIAGLVNSGLFFKDYIGVEVHFPKGTEGALPIKIDGCVFDSKDWLTYYQKWKANSKDAYALEFLRTHCIAIMEFKRKDEDVEKVFNVQVRSYLKEPDSGYVLGFLYDQERLFIFQKESDQITRYDGFKNKEDSTRALERLSLELPDSFLSIPSFYDLVARVNIPSLIDRSTRGITDLDEIANVFSIQVKEAMSNILKALDRNNLVNERGYQILIQTLALKIFDEKRNEKNPEIKLRFYINEDERDFSGLHETLIQNFIDRMKTIYDEAESYYKEILREVAINWKNEKHVRAVTAIVESFQDYSFVRSQNNDLYQLVFYNFARRFQKVDKAQYLTPQPLIDFLVKIVNPRGNESVCDPCVGIADFLSMAYVNAKRIGKELDDSNLWGVDIDEYMIMLAQLNMLLNGDGKTHLLKATSDDGSITQKISKDSEHELVQLIPSLHNNGNWDNWKDDTQLRKFNVVLTNPPFGKGRSFEVKTERDRQIVEMYESWNIDRESTKNKQSGKGAMDKGILFIENAYQILDKNGRMGIVTSNSIASIDQWKAVRVNWLMEKMRIVAIFDLPPEVFAETGVNTTLIVAYKPSSEELELLKSQNYGVFTREIKKVGYEKKTHKRNVTFEPLFKIDPVTFETVTDNDGGPVLDEEFSEYVNEFREWVLTQEETLQKLFIR